MEEFEVARMKIIGSTPLKLWLIEAETSNRIFTPELEMRKAFSLNRWLDVLVHVHCCVSMFYHPKQLGTVDVLYFVCSVLEMCCDCELIENSLFFLLFFFLLKHLWTIHLHDWQTLLHDTPHFVYAMSLFPQSNRCQALTCRASELEEEGRA